MQGRGTGNREQGEGGVGSELTGHGRVRACDVFTLYCHYLLYIGRTSTFPATWRFVVSGPETRNEGLDG